MQYRKIISIILFGAILFTTGVSISSADPIPPIPNTFSGTVRFANLSDQFDVPAGTLMEASIENVTKGSTIITTAGRYMIHVSGTYEDDGSNIFFSIGNFAAQQTAVFNASDPPPMTLNLIINLPEQMPGGGQIMDSCSNISSQGSYVLNRSITNSGALKCINITSSNVVFDGAGYTIDGVKAPDSYGVYVYNYSAPLTNVTVKNLKVTGWTVGIHYNSVHNGSIINSTANSNINGFSIFNGFNNTFSGDNASFNGDGVFFVTSSNNTINGSIITGNTGNGVGIFATSCCNVLSSNIISNNTNGISLDVSMNNIIYNNFFNNTNNSIQYLPNNWNITKTPGINIIGGSYLAGNVWAYPNGTGFSQTCTDGNRDGICDSSHTLDANNIDYLPLSMNFSSGTTSPSISFTDPTPADGATLTQNYAYINTTISNSANTTAFIDWNRSLAGWWRFNNESGESSTLFKDWSSWGNNGTCSGNACPTSTSGKFGNGSSFDGMNDYITMGNPSNGALDFGTGDFSVSSWFYMSSLPNAWKTIVSKGD
ncbi:MAG: right-handed parallel beta-helix repeat-containing protein, partial [Candidatus Methanoperedens sp.]|nr:right-handed parallel beta-helix repeat-containing protein [Candidatus Methanoperedens sp.]